MIARVSARMHEQVLLQADVSAGAQLDSNKYANEPLDDATEA